MSNLKLGGLFAARPGAAQDLEALHTGEVLDVKAAQSLGSLANEVLEPFEDGTSASLTERWLESALDRAQPRRLMQTVAILDVLAQRIDGEDGQRVRDLCTVVQKYAQLEGMVTIRTSSFKA